MKHRTHTMPTARMSKLAEATRNELLSRYMNNTSSQNYVDYLRYSKYAESEEAKRKKERSRRNRRILMYGLGALGLAGAAAVAYHGTEKSKDYSKGTGGKAIDRLKSLFSREPKGDAQAAPKGADRVEPKGDAQADPSQRVVTPLPSGLENPRDRFISPELQIGGRGKEYGSKAIDRLKSLLSREPEGDAQADPSQRVVTPLPSGLENPRDRFISPELQIGGR